MRESQGLKYVPNSLEIEPQYIDEAIQLAKAYPNMLEQKKFQDELRAGKVLYTEEMAIADLTGGGINYESDHVQSSNISNIPERIAIKLSEGYVEKKNAQMVREAMMSERQLAELDENIHIINVAFKKMTRLQQAVFRRIFFQRKSYSQIVESSHGKLNNWSINKLKNDSIMILAKRLMIQDICGGEKRE